MKTTKNSHSKHAVIIGASMGGLLSARVLSQHFDRVTLIEKDPVNDQPESRKGQPHTSHLHGLLAQGFDIMSHYFPNLKQELIENGAVVRDMGLGMRWFVNGGYRMPVNFKKEGVLVSRPMLEYLIRKFVLQRNNIKLLDGCSVSHLLFSADQITVNGVAVQQKGQGPQPVEIMADLIVDASGRGSIMSKWLENAGFSSPKETKVKVKLGYATGIYKRNPNEPGSRDWVFITPGSKKETRMGGAFPIENNQWLVTLAGLSGDHPSTERSLFEAFAKSLPAPDVHEVISQNEALTEIKAYKYLSSLRRHYERLNRFPKGLLVFGDAICSFNPIYGQGMTVASMEARLLDELLQNEKVKLDDLARAFFKGTKKILDIPWQTAVGEDFRFPETEGKKPAGTDFINAYISRIHRASQYDEVVCNAFLKVMNLLEPPTSLFHPNILWRTLFKRRKTVQEGTENTNTQLQTAKSYEAVNHQ